MTAINFTENDLTNTAANQNQRVQAYNDNVGTTLDFVTNGGMDKLERRTRNLIEDLGGEVVGYEVVKYQLPETDPYADNDNEPAQGDLFSAIEQTQECE